MIVLLSDVYVEGHLGAVGEHVEGGGWGRGVGVGGGGGLGGASEERGDRVDD